MAKTKKAAKKKTAKKIIKTDDLPNITFGQAIRIMVKPKKSTQKPS